MSVLVACERSQVVTKAFRSIGIEAYSCDIEECYGDMPDWHILNDAVEESYSGKYSLMIAHPPCTYLSRAGARWMYPRGELSDARLRKAKQAKNFFMTLLHAPIRRIAVENPIPLKIVGLPKHTQKIQPYEYGHHYSKATLLWLRGLPKLTPTKIIEDYVPYLPSNTGGKKRGTRATLKGVRCPIKAAKTFEGIAAAMAGQWGEYV